MNKLEKGLTSKQQDIRYLQNQLEAIHYDLYRNIDKRILTKALDKAAQSDSRYFMLAIQEALSLLRDAHTRVSENFRQEELFPVRYREIGGKYYITGALTPQSPLLGREVLKINNLSLETILPALSALSSKENSEVLYRDLCWFLRSNKILRYYGFSNSNQIVLTTNKGDIALKVDEKTQNLYQMNPLPWKKENYKNNSTYDGNSFYHFRIEGETLLFQYNDCTNEGYSKKYLNDFKQNLLNKAKEVKNIVIDFRLNDGGTTNIMENLFDNLPNNIPIYVAIGRGTFSATMHHLLYLKLNKNAILIGENAGQKPNRFGDCKKIVLPNSKIQIQSSFKYFELLPGRDIDDIKPDIRLPVTIDDYINNTDPLNQWVKENL